MEIIENIFAVVTSSTPLMILAVITCIMIIVAVLKRFMKLFIIAVVILLAYAGYLAYTGQEIPVTSEEIIRHGSQKLEQLKLDAMKERLKEKGQEEMENLIKDQLREKTDELLKKSGSDM